MSNVYSMFMQTEILALLKNVIHISIIDIIIFFYQ